MEAPTPLAHLQLAAADLARATSEYARIHLERLHARSDLALLADHLACALRELDEALAPVEGAGALEEVQVTAGLVGATHECLLEIAYSAEALAEEDPRRGG